MPAPQVIRLNAPLAAFLGLREEAVAPGLVDQLFSGSALPNDAEPLAMAYAGHQFGGFAPQLGDGRAVLLGELVGSDGIRRDVQLKGAGRTPFSRGGDGRAALGPILREYIVSEAMHAFGIPTTRALAAAVTGETVLREQPLPGAIITRVAESFVRVGTFQFFAARQDYDSVRTLADYVIARHYPSAAQAEHPYRELIAQVSAKQAALIAQWMHVGFIHGVMNTDNMQIAGETIDYGPCAFMDTFHPSTVYSSIDRMGRYAYANQPTIGHWNLACFASSLLPLLNDDEDAAVTEARAAIEDFPDKFQTAWRAGMAEKFGFTNPDDTDVKLGQEFLHLLDTQNADYTLAFRRLAELSDDDPSTSETLGALFDDASELHLWLRRWRDRADREPTTGSERQSKMQQVNPVYIPRNHLVEATIQSALQGDLKPFHALTTTLETPYVRQEGREAFELPPEPDEVVHQTFCGT